MWGRRRRWFRGANGPTARPIDMLFLSFLLLLGVPLGVLLVRWARTEERGEYRVDRRELRRLSARWRRMARTMGDKAEEDESARQVRLHLRLARQALRARRRNTGVVMFVKQWREPPVGRLDVPFERTHLRSAGALLTRLERAAGTTAAVEVDPPAMDDGGLESAVGTI